MKYITLVLAGVAGLLVGFSLEAHAQVLTPPATGIACAYNTPPPTLQPGQQGWAQCDAQGHLIISGVVSGGAAGGTAGGTVSQGPAGTAPWLMSISPTSAGLATEAQASVPINVALGTVQIVPATNGTATIITAWTAVAKAANGGSIELVSGSGTNCATVLNHIAGPYSFTTGGSGIAAGSGIGAMLFVPAGQALCVVTSAAFGGSVSYAQK